MGIQAAFVMPHPPIIVPTVGRGSEKDASKTIEACRAVARRLVDVDPDVIVVSSPHAPLYRGEFYVATVDGISGTMARFGAPKTRISAQCDVPLAKRIVDQAEQEGITIAENTMDAYAFDHGTFVPLYFVQQAYAEKSPLSAPDDFPCKIVSIGISGLPGADHRKLGAIIANAAADLGRRAVYLASGDLAHCLSDEGPYGFHPDAPVFENRIIEDLDTANFDDLFDFGFDFRNHAGDCGLRSFQIMAGALEEESARSGCSFTHRILNEESPFGIGYGVGQFLLEKVNAPDADPQDEETDERENGAADQQRPQVPLGSFDDAADPCVALARYTIENLIVGKRKKPLPVNLPEELTQTQAGCFVSLHERGQLRGCIGTLGPQRQNLAAEIASNAVSAATRDPRFPQVTPEDVPYLEYSVDVLGPLEYIDSEDQLDPQRFGVVVSKGFRRGVLLPRLDGVDTVRKQVDIARQKAGIRSSETGISLERFEVVRHTLGGAPREGVAYGCH